MVCAYELMRMGLHPVVLRHPTALAVACIQRNWEIRAMGLSANWEACDFRIGQGALSLF